MSPRIRTALVSLLAIALLAWFLRDANLGDVWSHVRAAHMGFLLLAGAAVPLSYLTRALRWQYLLAPLGPTRLSTVLRTTVIGFAALAVLPARAGDVLRPYLLARQEGLSPTATFATIIMERVLDLLVVLLLLALYVWGFSAADALPDRLLTPVSVSAALAGGAVAVLAVVMWILATHPERIGALILVVTRPLPARLGAGLARTASTFSSGFAATRDPRGLVMAVIWSVATWLLIGLETWAATRAFDIDMSLAGSFLLQALLVIGVAVPTPGGVGSFHEAYRFGVTAFFHAPNDRAVAAAIVLHLISFVPVVLAGVLLMARDGWSMDRLTDIAHGPDAEGAVLR